MLIAEFLQDIRADRADSATAKRNEILAHLELQPGKYRDGPCDNYAETAREIGVESAAALIDLDTKANPINPDSPSS